MTSQFLSRLGIRLPSRGKRVKTSESAEVQVMPFRFETPGTMNINGGVFTDVAGDINKIRIQNYHSAEAGIVQLKNAISGGAAHDSLERYPPPKCHPETRKAVLDRIFQWIRNSDNRNGVLWLHGPAGTGKSAIAQTIAEHCSQTKELAASFFFSREKQERNSTDHLWATIAFQIAQSIPELHDAIGSAVSQTPGIFHKSLSAQLQTLIVEPFSSLAEIPPNSSFLVIIDGLDECKDASQQYYILMFVAQLINTHRIPLRFVITSCPEPHIRKSFDHSSLQALSYPLCLDDTFRPIDDVRVFLRSEFDRIYQKRIAVMAHASRPWPSDNIVQRLAQTSGGRFLYAATILKFIDDEDYSPTDQLTVVLNTSSSSIPITGLDDLYQQILTTRFKNTVIFAAKIANTVSVPWVKTVTDTIVQITTRLETMGVSKQDSDNLESDIQALLYIISQCIDKNLNEWIIGQFKTRIQSMLDHLPDPIHHFTVRSAKTEETKEIISNLRQNLNNAAQLLQTDLHFSRVEKSDKFKKWKTAIGASDSGNVIKEYAHVAYTTQSNIRMKVEGTGNVFVNLNNSKFKAGKGYTESARGASVTHIVNRSDIDAVEDIDITTIATSNYRY